jgi:plasmid stabilization system protein ParE
MDMSAIYAHIFVESRGGAESVRQAISYTALALTSFPTLGKKYPRKNLWRIHVPAYPYSIYYTFNSDAISLVHIRHTRRRPL